jgi:hypothetical protein
LNISKKKGKKTKDLGGNEVEHKGSIQWMKPFVGLDDGSGREDVQDVTPVRRKKRSKSGTHPDPPVAAETVDIRTTNGSGSGSTNSKDSRSKGRGNEGDVRTTNPKMRARIQVLKLTKHFGGLERVNYLIILFRF